MFILPTASNPIMFKNRITGDEQSIVPKSGTVLQISWASQNIFVHKVGIVKPCNEVSYTITFKSVDRKLLNSTCLIGDSNTKGIKFGAGRGNVGEQYPRKQVYAPLIEHIDPMACVAYQNAIFSLGINDIRSHDIKSKRDIEKVFNRF